MRNPRVVSFLESLAWRSARLTRITLAFTWPQGYESLDENSGRAALVHGTVGKWLRCQRKHVRMQILL
jgi:hypothetical protein